jgi:hypothetical protein
VRLEDAFRVKRYIGHWRDLICESSNVTITRQRRAGFHV